MSYLRIHTRKNKQQNKMVQPEKTERIWYKDPMPAFSLAARLDKQDKDAALTAELRYFETLEKQNG